jgi:hypothetical protein
MQICIKIIVTTILVFAKYHENMKNKKGIFFTICFPNNSSNFDQKLIFFTTFGL